MNGTAQKPAATNAGPIAGIRWNIAVSGHAGEERRKIHSRITCQRKRMPKTSVHLHKNGWRTWLLSIFHHGHPVPAEGRQNGQRSAANFRIRLHADSHRTSGTSRMYIANALVREFGAQLTVVHQSKVSCPFALNEFLHQYCGRPAGDIAISILKLDRISGIARATCRAYLAGSRDFLRSTWLQDHRIAQGLQGVTRLGQA